MNDDGLSQDGDPGDEALGQRLAAYAAGRLTPGSSAITRMRTQVMAAAHRQAALARADATGPSAAAGVAGPSAAAAAPTPLHRGRRRRLVVALLAACLTIGLVVGSASASQAGGPLYPVRIWAETLTLPSSPSERAAAEVRRLEARLAEASEASAAGDHSAADAALEAYGNIVVSATADAGMDLGAGAILDSSVKHNITVLTSLAGRVPEPARDAIERAIQRSGTAVDQMHAKDGNPGTPTPDPGPVATQKPEKTRAPDATPKPDRTPKPAATPGANKTPGPNRTPGPDRTPRPDKTPPPGGQPSDKPGAPDSTPASQSGG